MRKKSSNSINLVYDNVFQTLKQSICSLGNQNTCICLRGQQTRCFVKHTLYQFRDSNIRATPPFGYFTFVHFFIWEFL